VWLPSTPEFTGAEVHIMIGNLPDNSQYSVFFLTPRGPRTPPRQATPAARTPAPRSAATNRRTDPASCGTGVVGDAPKPGPSGKVMVPVPRRGRLRPVETADRWEPEPRDLDAGWCFDGWIVKLDTAHYEPGIESAVEDGRGAQASS
jgi:hypothetical protein